MCQDFDEYLYCSRCHQTWKDQKAEAALRTLARRLPALVKKHGDICDDLSTRQLTDIYVDTERCETCKNAPKNIPKFRDSGYEIRHFFSLLWMQYNTIEMDLDQNYGPRKQPRQGLKISEGGKSMVF